MREIPIEWQEMDKVFGGANARLLRRNGLLSVEAVKDYIDKYPFEECSRYHASHYCGIGPVKYNQIIESLNRMKES